MEYPNRGTLWHNKFKNTDQKPDMKGDIKIEIDLFKELLAGATSDHVVIKLDGWLGKDKDGNRKISVKVDTYKKPEQQSQDNGKDPWDD
jgi:phosphoenolpyruvate carboxylase